MLATALRLCRAKVHAYCWTPHEAHLAIEVSDVPVGRLVQRVSGPYARRILQRRNTPQRHLFKHPYDAVLLDDRDLLLDLVRHLHWLPSLAEHPSDLASYAWSSHRCYLRLEKCRWLTTSTVLELCAQRSPSATEGYRQLMTRRENVATVSRLLHGTRNDRRVTGTASFLEWLTRRQQRPVSTLSLDELVNAVAARLGVEPADMRSPSRKRTLSLARALTTAHATRLRIANLSQVTRHFHRDPSTLITTVNRYQHLPIFSESVEDLLRQHQMH